MTIRDIAIAFGYKVDKKSEKAVNKSISDLKNTAKKALGAIGVGLSLVKANALIEEFKQVNLQLKSAVGEAKDFAKVQNDVLGAANNVRVSYSTMTSYVKGLMNSQNKLFSSTEKTLEFAQLTTKAMKAAGANESVISSLNSGIQSAFESGKVSAGTFTTLMQNCPEVVSYLSKTLGVTEQQVKALGTAGAITSNQLYSAFSSNASAIEKAYGNVSYTITDALTYIRNEFGLWLSQLDDTLKITHSISKVMIRAFSSIMNVLKKALGWVEKLNTKLGGAKRTLGLFVTLAGSVYAALNAGKILSFVKTLMSLLSAGSMKLMLIVGVVALIALLVEDFIQFLKGNDSMFGEALTSLGMDAEDTRKTLLTTFKDVLKIVKEVASTLKDTLGTSLKSLGPSLKDALGAFVKGTSQVLPVLAQLLGMVFSLLGNILSSIMPVLTKILGKVIELVTKILDKVLPIVASLLESVMPLIEEIINSVLPIVVELLDAICPLLDSIFALLTPIINSILPVVTKVLGLVCNVLKEVLSIIMPIINAVLPILTSVLDTVCDVLTSVLSILDPLLELIELVLDLLGPILGILTPLITILLNLINFALQPGLKMISLIVELVSKKLANAIKMITLLLTPLIRFLQVLWDIFGKIYTVISNLISKAINPFKEALDGIFDKLGGIFDLAGGVLDKVSGLFGGGSDSGGGGIVSNVVSGVKGAIGKVKGFLGLAEGGYVGPNSPRTVVIGDNTKEGEIVSPISKMRNTVLQALRIFSSASNPAGAASTLGKEASNRTVSQIVNITNQFNGGTTDQQKNGARAMKKSAEDATGIMARGLAYAR